MEKTITQAFVIVSVPTAILVSCGMVAIGYYAGNKTRKNKVTLKDINDRIKEEA